MGSLCKIRQDSFVPNRWKRPSLTLSWRSVVHSKAMSRKKANNLETGQGTQVLFDSRCGAERVAADLDASSHSILRRVRERLRERDGWEGDSARETGKRGHSLVHNSRPQEKHEEITAEKAAATTHKKYRKPETFSLKKDVSSLLRHDSNNNALFSMYFMILCSMDYYYVFVLLIRSKYTSNGGSSIYSRLRRFLAFICVY